MCLYLLNLFKFRHSCCGMIFFWIFKYLNTSFILKYPISTFLISFISKTCSFFASTAVSSSTPCSSLSQLFPLLLLQAPRPDSRGSRGRRTAEAGTVSFLSCQSPLDSDAMRLHSPFEICSHSAFGFQHLPLSHHPLVSPHPTTSPLASPLSLGS